MSDRRPVPVAAIISAVLILTGLVWSVHSLAQRSYRNARLERRKKTILELADLATRAEQQRTAVAAVERMTRQSAVPLDALIRSVLGGRPAETREAPLPFAPPDGWSVRRVQVSMPAVPYDILGQALRRAAAQQPPWVVVDCMIRASPSAGRASKAVVVFECVERKIP